MGQVPLHPALVHIPIGIALVLPLVALGVTVALWRGWIAPRAFALVVLLQALVVAGGFAALQTGESEGERIEDTVGEAAVESHEHAAKRFMIGAGIALAIGAGGLFLLRRQSALRWTAAALTAATVLEAGLAVATGKRGGELVYAQGGVQTQVAGARHGGENEGDD